MIEADAGDNREDWLRCVCGIQSAAEPGLNHCNGHFLAGKVHHGNGRHDLKPGWAIGVAFFCNPIHSINSRHHMPEGVDKIRRRDCPVIDSDAFFQIVYMRRHVASDGVAGLSQDGCNHGHSGALSFGAGHVHDRKVLLWRTNGGKQSPHAGQAECAG